MVTIAKNNNKKDSFNGNLHMYSSDTVPLLPYAADVNDEKEKCVTEIKN